MLTQCQEKRALYFKWQQYYVVPSEWGVSDENQWLDPKGGSCCSCSEFESCLSKSITRRMTSATAITSHDWIIKTLVLCLFALATVPNWAQVPQAQSNHTYIDTFGDCVTDVSFVFQEMAAVTILVTLMAGWSTVCQCQQPQIESVIFQQHHLVFMMKSHWLIMKIHDFSNYERSLCFYVFMSLCLT